MITLPLSILHIHDLDLGNALMKRVLTTHQEHLSQSDESKPVLRIIATPTGERLGWNNQFSHEHPDTVGLANAANILMDGGEESPPGVSRLCHSISPSE